jgi:hypothetical protein
MSDSAESYLRDTLGELLDRARKARREVASAGGDRTTSEATAFAQGRAIAYYEVVDHLINQLDAFGIDRTVVGIDRGFDATKDLL